jgi:hypothetical protein
MNPLETYIRVLYDIRSTGAAHPITWLYPIFSTRMARSETIQEALKRDLNPEKDLRQ